MLTSRTLAGILVIALPSFTALAQTQPPSGGDEDWAGFNKSSGAATTPSTTQPAPAATQPAAATPAPAKAAAQPGTAQPAAATPATAATSPSSSAPATVAAPSAATPAPTATSTTPAPAKSMAPAPTVAAAPAPRPTLAPDGGILDPNAPRLVSTKDTILPEEDPHSPATLNDGLSDENNIRNTAAINGEVGLFHVQSADFGHANTLHLSVVGEYFTSGDFPVQGASEVRSAGTFALGYTFIEWLQVYVSYAASANSNSRSAPTLIQDQGDLTFGLSLGKEFAPGFHAGLDLRGEYFPGVGNQSLASSAFGFYPRALLTYAANPHAPVRLHLNVGVELDKDSGLAGSHTLTASEQFALNINQYNRFALGLGVEFPIPIVTPFAEYNAHIPLGASNLVAPDNTSVSTFNVMNQTLGFGVRLTAIKDVTLQAGIDLGLARTVAYGIPATMPWNLLFGLTYNIDPIGAVQTKLTERVYERTVAAPAPLAAVAVAPPTGKIVGVVVDAANGRFLPGVLITLAGSDLPPVATDSARGQFSTYDLPPGVEKLNATLSGYHTGQADALVEAGKSVEVQIKLVRSVQPGTLNVKLSSKGKPVTAAVQITGEATATIQAQGEGSTELVPGHYVLHVAAEGFEPATEEVDIKSATERRVDFELKPLKKAGDAGLAADKPKKVLVLVTKNKIVIKQAVHFATGKAVILKDSNNLLDQVAEAIADNGLKKVEVAGHTDNQGDKAANLELSQLRAESVRAYLLKKGIDGNVIVAKGYGDTKPVAPNMTPKGRELNRRVEFNILDR